VETQQSSAGVTETSLVRKAQKGDVEAFSSLVRLYQRRVVSVAYRLLGNGEDARDVAQDAFVRAYRALGQLEDANRFGPWLMRVVSNLSLNFRRSRKLRAAVSLDGSPENPSIADDPSAGHRQLKGNKVDAGIMAEETSGAIQVAMAQLPEKQRLALILFSVEGMPQNEVAEILDCTVELVKWNVFQARKKLKEALADYL